MCKELDMEDTDPNMSLRQTILDELHRIRSDLRGINERIEKVEERLGGLEQRVEDTIRDVSVVHELQRTYTGRLTVIEQMCVDKPLVTATPTPIPRMVDRR